MRGHFAEGIEWLSRLLRQAESAGPSADRAKALNGLGNLAWSRCDYGLAEACHRESFAIRRQLADDGGIAASLNNLGLVAWHRGEYSAARQLLERALARSRTAGDHAAQALHLNNLCNVHHDQGAYGEARQLQEESLATFLDLGNKWGVAMARCDLGRSLHALGETSRARVLCEKSLDLRRRLGDRPGQAGARVALGQVAKAVHEYATARDHFARGLALAAEVGDRRGMARALEGLAVVSATEGQAEPALRLAAAAATLREALGAPPAPAEQAQLQRELASSTLALGREGTARVWAEGSGLSAEQAAVAGMACVVQTSDLSRGAAWAPEVSAGLTPRERKTAALLARGLSNRQIAAELVITEGTAKLHVKHILRKLGLTSRAQVTAWSLQHGLLETGRAQLAG